MQQQQQQKKSGLQRIFPFNKSSSSKQQQPDPFASLNPFGAFVAASASASTEADSTSTGIDSILKKYAAKSPAVAQQQAAECQLIGEWAMFGAHLEILTHSDP